VHWEENNMTTKFEEIFNRGMPLEENIHCTPDVNHLYLEWQKFHDKTQRYLERTKNRIPIVDFNLRSQRILPPLRW